MQNESIIVDDFNLHHLLWTRSFYSRQHALSKTLLKLMRITNATLMLFKSTIIKNCHEKRTAIDLFFKANTLINKLIRREINYLIKKKRSFCQRNRALNLRITYIRSDKIKRMMRERDREWLADVMSSSSLRERDEIDAKSTSDVNTIEIKKKRNDDAKTVKDFRAKIIQITRFYELWTKKIMSALDQLIKASRVTRTNDVSSMLKSTWTIRKLKKMTTRLKKIAEKMKTHRKKSNI